MLTLQVSSFLSSFWSILIALSALLIMIMVHEAGHYVAGKMLGFKINEFAIGFGPPILKKRMNSGEMFSIRAVPLGGFCAFEGEDEDNPNEQAFNNHKPWKRIVVLLAGATFNFISAIIVFTLFFSIYGYNVPTVYDTHELVSGEEHILHKGDQILKVGNKNIYGIYESNLGRLINESGDTLNLTIVREGEKIVVQVPIQEYEYLNADDELVTANGIGIQVASSGYKFNIFSNFIRAIRSCGEVIVLIISTLGKLFSGIIGIKGNLAGPITTVTTISSVTAQAGIAGYLSVLAVISVSIAFTNILPLPALDGSRIVFTIIEWIRRKPISRKVEGMIHTVGLILLFSLTILLDILNFV